ncbi:MAG TPA: alpha/beta hydrolase [Bacillota bacterium]|nr:alpha/beta hydrolase [Bacillota bacterium]HSX36735.1 alpha/beta hydrolase [Patescibacteria group bacterium]
MKIGDGLVDVVYVPGLGDDPPDAPSPVLRALADAGMTAYAPRYDWRNPSLSLGDFANTITHEIGTQQLAPHVTLVGHSLGALLCGIEVQARANYSKLVVCSPTISGAEGMQRARQYDRWLEVETALCNEYGVEGPQDIMWFTEIATSRADEIVASFDRVCIPQKQRRVLLGEHEAEFEAMLYQSERIAGLLDTEVSRVSGASHDIASSAYIEAVVQAVIA